MMIYPSTNPPAACSLSVFKAVREDFPTVWQRCDLVQPARIGRPELAVGVTVVTYSGA